MNNTENKKKVYTLTITDENGEVLKEIETNCIIFSANNLKENATASGAMCSCKKIDTLKTIMGLDDARKRILKEDPLLAMILELEGLSTKSTAKETGSEEDGGIKVVEEQP